MHLAYVSNFGEQELAALNAKADARSLRDASAWDEAVDWGAQDYGTLCPLDGRMATAPEFD
jgi:hypothetical protein